MSITLSGQTCLENLFNYNEFSTNSQKKSLIIIEDAFMDQQTFQLFKKHKDNRILGKILNVHVRSTPMDFTCFWENLLKFVYFSLENFLFILLQSLQRDLRYLSNFCRRRFLVWENWVDLAMIYRDLQNPPDHPIVMKIVSNPRKHINFLSKLLP